MSKIVIYILLLASFSGCRLYNQNIMFRTEKSIKSSKPIIEAMINRAEKNYIVQIGDHIEVRLYTAEGEEIINPRAAMVGIPNGQQIQVGGQMGQGGMMMQSNMMMQQGAGNGFQSPQFPLDYPDFTVWQSGQINLPKLGLVKIEGLTLMQVDSTLSLMYNKFFEKSYVRSRFNNKRVVVFRGATGTVIPLRSENMNLLEILALTGGMPNDQRARNIRLIRGDLKDPDVYVINLSKIEGLTAQDLTIQPNDIVYVEPVRKSVFETLNDVSPLLSLITSLITFGLVLRSTR
jgi:polysaccharide export outer membrane protein